jgi:hypothetical protein
MQKSISPESPTSLFNRLLSLIAIVTSLAATQLVMAQSQQETAHLKEPNKE